MTGKIFSLKTFSSIFNLFLFNYFKHGISGTRGRRVQARVALACEFVIERVEVAKNCVAVETERKNNAKLVLVLNIHKMVKFKS